MEDLPSIGRIGAIRTDTNRRQDREQRDPKRRKEPADDQTGKRVEPADDEYQPSAIQEPTASLVETLDRLRATGQLNPAEETTRRLLRGIRYYHDQPHRPPDDVPMPETQSPDEATSSGDPPVR